MKRTRSRIIITGPIVKYPWGGLTQYWLGWLVGLKQLGHEVFYAEDAEWECACYDIPRRIMTSDPSYGIERLRAELSRYQLEDNLCFVGHDRHIHGMPQQRFQEMIRTADVFIDLEYDTLKEFRAGIPLTIYVDGEPGWNQLGMQKLLDQGGTLPAYHLHFTLGMNIGTPRSNAPTLGIDWKPMMCPVLPDLPVAAPPKPGTAFSTVMQWKANPELQYHGKTFGMKDREFHKFLSLPEAVKRPMEIAVSGRGVPRDTLASHGWILKDGDDVSTTVENYHRFIQSSRGEFSVVKNAGVETNCGLFMERSGYYMLSKRPVVLQDNGWSQHLPTGRGLFAVRTVEEAAESIRMIDLDYELHSQCAYEIAQEYLNAPKVLRGMLHTAGLG
jgi:hypothetical protein